MKNRNRFIIVALVVVITGSLASIFQGCGIKRQPPENSRKGMVVFVDTVACYSYIVGDINLDGQVNAKDIEIYDDAVLDIQMCPCPDVFDVDGNGEINTTLDKQALEDIVYE